MPDLFSVAFNSIAPIMLCAGIGYLFGRRFQPDPRLIARISLYVMLPSLAFTNISAVTLDPREIGTMIVIVAILALVLVGTAWGVGRRSSRLSHTTRSGFVLSALLMNTGNYGLPFIQFALGDEGLRLAAIVFVLSNAVTTPLGIYVASSGAVSVRRALGNVFNNPLPYAVLGGIAVSLFHIELPLFVTRSIGIFGQGSVPILLLLLGVQMSRISLANGGWRAWHWGSLLWVVGLRLMLAPVLVLGLCALFGVTGLTRDVLVLQLSTPTAVTASVLASEFGSDAEFVSAAILLTTLASVVTLSALLILMMGGL